MKTTVYVDGYNLYYSLLRTTGNKWVNLSSLFKEILFVQDPSFELTSIKYYTADVKSKFSIHGPSSQAAQHNYHRALLTTDIVEIIKGSHSVDRSTSFKYLDPPELNERVAVWKIEEKETDVNIALDMYRDAIRGEIDQVVLCSNDTDLTRALEYISKDCPGVQIGLITPLPEQGKSRRYARSLDRFSHWTRRYVSDDELKKSQFPDRVPTRKKPIKKPEYW